MGVAASATAIAGLIVGMAGYATLAIAGAVAAAGLAPFLVAVVRLRHLEKSLEQESPRSDGRGGDGWDR
jgi:hypothetical protein